MIITPLYVFGAVALITAICMYLDSKTFDTKKSFFTYLKNMILCATCSTLTFKFLCKKGGENQGGGASGWNSTESFNRIPDGEHVLHGIYPRN